MFDGRIAKPKRRSAAPWLALAILAAAGVAVLRPWKPASPSIEPPSARVVSVRPGGARRAPDAKLSEPEAMRALRRHLASGSVPADCLVISSQGWREGAYRLTALNRCAGTPLGRFRVDLNSGAVAQE